MAVVRVGIIALTVLVGSAFADSNPNETNEQSVSGVQLAKQGVRDQQIATMPEHGTPHVDARLGPLEVTPGYEVNQIPFGSGRFAWIDNDVILFAGVPHPKNESQRGRSPIGLYRWQISSASVTKISDLGDAPDVCYDRGHLYVAFNRGEQRVIRQGPIDQQEEIAVIRGKPTTFPRYFNRFDCRFRDTPPATQPKRGVTDVLREDHGFIEMEYGTEVHPPHLYFLVRPNAEPIPIDLRCGAGGPRYVPFLPGYVFQDGRSFSDHRVGPLVCVVAVNGTVATYRLPPGDWLRATVYGVPMRSGVLMVSLATMAKAHGAYLVRGESVEKLISGYINQFEISPDGCKVALSISPRDGVRARVAVLKVCNARE